MLLRLATVAVLCGFAVSQEKIRVLLITGKNNHDWEYTHIVHKKTLESTGRFEVTITKEPGRTLADDEEVLQYQVFFLDFNSRGGWGEKARHNFVAAVHGGTGVAVIHAANNAFPGWVEYEKMVGHLWRKGTGHGRVHEFDVEIVDRAHPITLDMRPLVAQPDELYHRLVHMHGVEYRLLMRALSSKESGGTGNYEPMCTVLRYGYGRIFHTPLGHVWRKQEHTRRSVNTPQFKLLIARGTEWAATGRVTIRPEAFGLRPIAPNELTEDETRAGWELLFDGSSTEAWRGYRRTDFPPGGWVVADGCLKKVKDQRGGDLVTKAQFADFEFQCEWKIEQGGNSGIIYLCTEEEDAPWMTGPELQVLDEGSGKGSGDPKTAAGACYGLVACGSKFLHPAGRWNHTRIVVRRPHVEHWLNGAKVLDYELDGEQFSELVAKSKFKKWKGFAKARKGHIALQDHGSAVQFRSLKVRRLDPR